jgi:CBS domain-containing protein
METNTEPRTDFLAARFSGVVVSDAMQHGVLSCRAFTPLVTVARIMAAHDVHSVVMTGHRADDSHRIGPRTWGIVTDVDLMQAADRADELTALDVATTDVQTVTPDTPLREAAELMARRRISHVVVVDPESDEPRGVVSSLDIARRIAWSH